MNDRETATAEHAVLKRLHDQMQIGVLDASIGAPEDLDGVKYYLMGLSDAITVVDMWVKDAHERMHTADGV